MATSETPHPAAAAEDLSAQQRLDAACVRFEAAWQAGQRPRIEDFLDAVAEAERPALLLELLHLELEYRRRCGEDVGADDYRMRFPRHAALVEKAFAAVDSPGATVDISHAAGVQVSDETRSADGTELPKVPGYEILGVLGRGGMGIVYQARQVALDRLVALKMILQADHAGSEERDRFRTEAEAVARLQHPNIVQIYEVGEHQGLPYFSLEYCAGGSLAQKLNGTPLPASQAAQLVQTLAHAMHAAHTQHIVHRDLKPANVLLTQDGTPKVADFGLARRLDRQGATRTGAVMGTPSYIAPEQAQGKKGVGPAADVYALGAILYELLTGRPPFKSATDLDTMLQVISEEPVSVRRLQPKVPRDLETVCHKCLHKDPTKRYASAAALAEDLRRFAAGEPVTARPLGGVARAVRWARRRPALVAVMALGVVAGVAGLIGVQLARERTQMEIMRGLRDEAERNKEEADVQRARAEAQELLTKRLLYLADMSRAERAWREDQHRLTLDLLERHRPAADGPDVRGFEWYYLNRLWVYPNQVTLKHHLPIQNVVFSPDGRWLATAGLEPGVRVWEVSTGRRFATLWEDAEEVTSLAFSPDGKSLFYGGTNGTLKVWDINTFEGPRTVSRIPGIVTGLTFTADGTRVAASRKVGKGKDSVAEIVLWDVRTGREERVIHCPWRTIDGMTFSPDGSRLAFEAWEQNKHAGLKVYDTRGGHQAVEIQADSVGPWPQVQPFRANPVGAWVQRLAFSADNRSLAAACGYGTVRVWELSTGREVMRLKGHSLGVLSVAFSPDGRRLASGSEDGTVKIWDTAMSQEVITLTAAQPPGGPVQLGRQDAQAPVIPVTGNSQPVRVVRFDAQGFRLAMGSDDATVRIWDASPLPAKPSAEEARVIGLRRRMMEPIPFRGFNDPQTTLEEALSAITILYKFPSKIDLEAFSAYGLGGPRQNIWKTKVAETPIPAISNRGVDVVLRALFSRLPAPAAFVVDANDSTIVITTQDRVHDAVTTPTLEKDGEQERKVHQHLLQTITFEGFDDPETTLQEALGTLCATYGLKYAVDEESFQTEDVKNVLRTQMAFAPQTQVMKASLHSVLECVLSGVDCPSGCSYMVRDDSIVILTRAKKRRALADRLAKAAKKDERAREELRFMREKEQPTEDLWAKESLANVGTAFVRGGSFPLLESLLSSEMEKDALLGGSSFPLLESLLSSGMEKDALLARWAYRRALTIATRFCPSYLSYSEWLRKFEHGFGGLPPAPVLDWCQRILGGFRRLEKAATPEDRAANQTHIDYLEQEIRMWTPVCRAIEKESFALGQPKAEAARLLYIRALFLAPHHHHPEAATSARKMLDLDPADPETLYRAARCYALCGTRGWLVTPKESPTQRKTVRDEYEARAVELLAKAIKHGYARGLDARTDSAFSSIRDRPDFKKLLRELEERKGKDGAAR
jgi:WD40 repeat protein